MTDLTNWNDTSDVSDAAIEWVLVVSQRNDAASVAETAAELREDAANGAWCYAKMGIIAARLIQQHRPDLLVDPVDAIVREEVERLGSHLASFSVSDFAKRLYLMGIEKGKGA